MQGGQAVPAWLSVESSDCSPWTWSLTRILPAQVPGVHPGPQPHPEAGRHLHPQQHRRQHHRENPGLGLCPDQLEEALQRVSRLRTCQGGPEGGLCAQDTRGWERGVSPAEGWGQESKEQMGDGGPFSHLEGRKSSAGGSDVWRDGSQGTVVKAVFRPP